MKMKRILSVISLLSALTFFVPCHGWAISLFRYGGERQVKPETHAPIITNAFAVEKGYYGYIWKIYVEAEDPDGDMLRIASVVDQVGYGHYPTDWTYLKAANQKNFRGYIQWNTFSSRAHSLREWTEIMLKISVFDKAGNESNVWVFPFTFEMGRGRYEYKPPAPFDQGDLPRLGYVHIDLFDTADRSSGVLDNHD